jgi:hypothetical protein
LAIELENSKGRTAQIVADGKKPSYTLWTLVITAVAGPIVTMIGLWFNARYAIAATNKAEATTVAKADEVKDADQEKNVDLKKTLEDHGEKLNDLNRITHVASDASVKNWAAYNSKDQSDMDVAAKALSKAERVIEATPAIPAAAMPK